MTETKKRAKSKHRTPEQMVADLEAKIEKVKARAAAKELKQSEAFKKTLGAIRQLDKAIEAAKAEGATALRNSLLSAREPLAKLMEAEGLKLPQPRKQPSKDI